MADDSRKPMKYRERMRHAAAALPKWISPQVAAEALGVDDSTILRMIRRGTLRGDNIEGPGSPIRILMSDFEEYLVSLRDRIEAKTKKRPA